MYLSNLWKEKQLYTKQEVELDNLDMWTYMTKCHGSRFLGGKKTKDPV